MFEFPRTISPRRRLVFSCLGVFGVLVLWWLVTLPVFTEQRIERTSVPSGEFEVLPHPTIPGETIRKETQRIVETTVDVRRALVNPPALASPPATFRDAVELLTRKDPNLLEHMGRSTMRILLGFLISSIVAVPLGIAMGLFPHLRALLSPLISFLRPLPSISWVPLAMIWMGAGEWQKLAIVFMGSFSAAVIYTIEATVKVSPDLIKAAQNLGANDRQLLWKVLLPAALPNIISGLKVVMAIGWTCVISAEIVGTQVGLGALIWQSKETSDTAAVLVGMTCISGIVLLLDLATTRIERWLLPWVFLEERRG